MSTLWAIEIQPFNLKAKPWVDYLTVRGTRKAAWEAVYERWQLRDHKELNKRRRSGMMRAVKVTIGKASK